MTVPSKPRIHLHSRGPSMRNNKAILDEAARSVRRTFVGSVAGSIGMLAVVGAAGAYGMPEKLTTQALAAAMAKLNMKFPRVEHAAAEPERPVHDHVVQVADNAKLRAISPVSDVAPEDAIVRAVPQVVSEVAPPAIAAENTSVVAKTPPAIQAAPVRNPFTANDPEPAPAVTASLTPPALPEVAEERPILSAPMVFEAPKPADAQVLMA